MHVHVYIYVYNKAAVIPDQSRVYKTGVLRWPWTVMEEYFAYYAGRVQILYA